MEFDKKVIIITGGAQGIGRAISQLFSINKAYVIIADIDEKAARETLDTIIFNHGEAKFVKTDVTSEDDIKNLIHTTIDVYSKIDILINNAGINHVESIYSIDSMDFDKVIATNLRSVFLCSKYAAIEMKKRNKGVIINLASTRALMSEANTESYAASKGGIVALTHALAVSLGKDGIRVNAISPGWIEVSNWQKSSESSTPMHTKADKEQHPVGRVGHPTDIAEACLYLASDKSSFVTGQNIIIDGGMTKKMIYEE